MNRRRVLYGGKEELIERPDCIRVDFTTTADNVEIQIGYTLYTGDIILDDSKISLSANYPTPKIKVPNAGSHILYIYPYSSGTGSFYFTHAATYIRLPYNFTSKIPHLYKGAWVSWTQLDILDSNRLKVESGWGTWEGLTLIRVPIGAKQQYIDAGVASAITNKMIEYNFKYKIE